MQLSCSLVEDLVNAMLTKMMLAASLTLCLCSVLAFAQQSSSQPVAVSAGSVRPLIVSGKVSADGKSLLTDIDSEWIVSNAETLKGHEGRLVTVKCYVDTEKNRLQVLTVRRTANEVSSAARQSDSAFRR
jgi:hypothetical protein